jgi:hypothetical protein
VVTGGKANVHGFNGTTASSFAIPREMQVGDTKFICPVATNSSNPTDPPILGLLSFVSFHKVVFDFAGGAIYYPKTAVPMSGLNELLYFNGLQISSSGTLEGIPSWDLKPHIDIPAKQITSLFDLPFTPSEAFFKNWKTYANYVLSMANLVFQKHNLKVVYGNPSKSLTLRPSTKFFVTTDIGPPPTTEEDRVPGVYLIRPGKQPTLYKEGTYTVVGKPQMETFGGAALPILVPTANPGEFIFDVWQVGTAAQFLGSDSPDGLSFYLKTSGEPTSFASYPYPIFADKGISAVNIGDWTLCPYGENHIIYYPPKWNIPFGKMKPRTPGFKIPPAPQVPPAEFYWIWANGQSCLDIDYYRIPTRS